LDFFARANGLMGPERSRAVRHVMGFTRLDEIAEKYTDQLSKGMRQRLCLGRALEIGREYSIERGVIPVLITKSDRAEGDDRHNATLRALAAEYALPLWDFDVVAGTLPDRGLRGDSVHLTSYATDDYTDPATLGYGYPLSDLTGLMMLDAIRQIIEESN
ncbi:MAG TPA: hypothetical protein PKJ56_11055, partial [Promineifilum sp.]|nr:hypothetical protein [Promineifilum sp.]